MADTPDLKSVADRRMGSNPIYRTILNFSLQLVRNRRDFSNETKTTHSRLQLFFYVSFQ